MSGRAHLVVGGFPIGSNAGHDMDFVRIQLLQMLYRHRFHTTVAQDFSSLDERLQSADFLVSYVAGPYPNDDQTRLLEQWLSDGGKWFALHGTSGGRAKRLSDASNRREMVRLPHHDLLGAYFLNHPPVRRFKVRVEVGEHALFRGLPSEFEVEDELYLVEPIGVDNPLLSTELVEDPSPPGFGFHYTEDTSIQSDGKTRFLGTERLVGKGAVCYVALGHTHSPSTNMQPFVDSSVNEDGTTPTTFRGPWSNDHFLKIVENAMDWGQTAA
ncbi:MAG: ThuA domain-containing protein [Gammaproteobacteria bacterium]|nr:ThuA domain-containing protein [Gammaproteobacteria bacterium]MYD81190.1 ThuA domain-containing protein [Gammaproteobacteria bacterium]